jgi:hypothetical protein
VNLYDCSDNQTVAVDGVTVTLRLTVLDASATATKKKKTEEESSLRTQKDTSMIFVSRPLSCDVI